MENSSSLPARKSPPDPRDDGRPLKIKEAAAYLTFSTRTLQTAARSGRLRTVRLSLRPGTKRCMVRYLRADLDAFFESCMSGDSASMPGA